MPQFAGAETFVSWQKLDAELSKSIRLGAGAFITQQGEHVLISSALETVPPRQMQSTIVENMPLSAEQSQQVYIVSQGNVISTLLAENEGNRAYAATAAFKGSTLVVGGINAQQASNQVNLLIWQEANLLLESFFLPSLPIAAKSPSAVIVEDTLYVLTGSGTNNQFFALDLSALIANGKLLRNHQFDYERFAAKTAWRALAALPIANSIYQNGVQLATQNDGSGDKIFAIGGYRLLSQDRSVQHNPLPLTAVWKFDPATEKSSEQWQKVGNISDANSEFNQQVNSLSTFGHSHILAFTEKGDTLSFNAITNAWTQYSTANGEQNTPAIVNGGITDSTMTNNGDVYALSPSLGSGSSSILWQASLKQPVRDFGWINMSVLVAYLIFVVLVGLFFVFKNRTTNDYFRGGQSIPWWAAACSIYATMLSSLTYVALPAVVFQSNWLLLLGIWMIIAVAPIAIYVAMPFFRQIDATSAYEYLSKRFNMSVRLFASGLFTLFHVGRMGIVMALTALALSAVTPLSPSESVLIMGVLCLIYCTMGGIEAVIWTDTLQTIVLLIGAVLCFIIIIAGLDGGMAEFISIGLTDNKFTMVDVDFSLDSITTLSIWVVVIGGIGQNLSSYTADQAVVQRYMVTKNPKEASRSIWANAIIAAPAALLFFCIGTGLYVFYQTHPEKLDPTIQIDQIFPTFIATELPVGLAGLIVAGIFAAAQSTVSTSMNSIATTLVTDFIRPFNLVKTEQGYMRAARWLTFIMGVLGTLAGLIFIDPEIRSLMEAYFKVIGMFMGALGGLFVLGALTKKANSVGALVGILAGVATMISAWQLGWANGYLYATIGIVSCLVFGYLASLLTQSTKAASKDLTGLTLYTMRSVAMKSS
ncbi:sodium/solute symporter [Shewanella sp. 10N.261.52.F9]|uniref:sodium:solute symporter n=1 Tax=Shewanella sp. 10N.261.52.F9 TaxID=3229684 RepID=UPI0035508CF6